MCGHFQEMRKHLLNSIENLFKDRAARKKLIRNKMKTVRWLNLCVRATWMFTACAALQDPEWFLAQCQFPALRCTQAASKLFVHLCIPHIRQNKIQLELHVYHGHGSVPFG